MSPSGGSHDTTHPRHFVGNARNYALVRQSLRLNGSRRRHTTSCKWLSPGLAGASMSVSFALQPCGIECDLVTPSVASSAQFFEVEIGSPN